MQTKQKQSKQSGGPSRPVVEKVPMKVSALTVMSATALAQESSKVKDPVVVLITSGDRLEQLTFCRPVGITPLAATDWIAAPTAEMQSILSRAEDPSGKIKEEARRKLRTDRLVALGRLVKAADGKIAYPVASPQGGQIVSVVIDAAKAAHKAREAVLLGEYLQECERAGRQPKKDWKSGKTWQQHLSEDVVKYERESEEKLSADPAYTEGLKKIEPVPYETMAGLMGERHQLRYPFPAMSGKNNVVEHIKIDLMRASEAGRAFPCAPAHHLKAAFAAAGDDPQKLKDFIFSFAFPGLKPT